MNTRGERVLAVDDDPDLLRLLSLRLKSAGFEVATANGGAQALAALAASRPQVVLTDLRMAGMDGIALFEAVCREYPGLPVIILTAHGTIPDAVAATQRGVFGYLEKPVDAQRLAETIRAALRTSAADQQGETDEVWRADMITRSPKMEAVLAKARQVAAGDAPVLILGRAAPARNCWREASIGRAGARAVTFVAINCGAIPENLLESELFGYVKGAFTGAARDHAGLFAAAAGGTLLLDEIGDMPISLQVKLLRVLQEHEVRPLGATRPQPIDVRIVSATHRNLSEEMAQNRFRADLYYRLNVIALELPRLADRRGGHPTARPASSAAYGETVRQGRACLRAGSH
ncbi:MAG: sigma 54-interacting transcriptional regulator [Rhodocyclaceae bacterium]|nr:sigma 54-interacting transcriptional regulator [Rhodocyclaceae bacterium]